MDPARNKITNEGRTNVLHSNIIFCFSSSGLEWPTRLYKRSGSINLIVHVHVHKSGNLHTRTEHIGMSLSAVQNSDNKAPLSRVGDGGGLGFGVRTSLV